MGAEFIVQNVLLHGIRKLVECLASNRLIMDLPHCEFVFARIVVGQAARIKKRDECAKTLLTIDYLHRHLQGLEILYLSKENDWDWIASNHTIYELGLCRRFPDLSSLEYGLKFKNPGALPVKEL